MFGRRRPNPVLDVHTHFIDKLAVLNGVLSGAALYPQVGKVLMTLDFTGVSLASFVIIFFNNIVWLVYAFHRGLISLLIAALLNVIAAGVLVGAMLLI
jgi:uncharacterized protein with PQ loop repeat